MANLKETLQNLHAQLGDLIGTYLSPTNDQEDFIVRSKLIAKSKQIEHALLKPEDVAVYQSSRMTELVVLRVVHQLELFQYFEQDIYTSIEDIAAQSKVQPALLIRILRMLTASGYLKQHAEHVHSFSLTTLGVGAKDIKDFYSFFYDDIFTKVQRVHEFITDSSIPGYTPLTEATDSRYCPATWQAGCMGETIWTYMKNHPAMIARAQKVFMNEKDMTNNIIGAYDFNQLAIQDKNSDRLSLVDVGGGAGQSIAQILAAYPQLESGRFMLQDLEGPISMSRQMKLLPEASVKVVHDFFSPQPDVARGAKSFLLRRIIHDWSDETCVTILKHLVAAMANDSRVLICDVVVPERIEEKDTRLLVNDWVVMSISGKERTQADFERLFGAAGLELVKVHRKHADSGANTIVEACLQRTNTDSKC